MQSYIKKKAKMVLMPRNNISDCWKLYIKLETKGSITFKVDGHRKYVTQTTGRASVDQKLCRFSICSY